jgi:uncharacterized Ntn-hydrolase superfamily protein
VKGGYEGYSDRYVDLRVDEHVAPIDELKRVLNLRHDNAHTRRPKESLDQLRQHQQL